MIFLGYKPGTQAYRLWNPSTKSIHVSASVRFHETVFPRKQKPTPITAADKKEEDPFVIVPLPEEESTPTVPAAELPKPAPLPPLGCLRQVTQPPPIHFLLHHLPNHLVLIPLQRHLCHHLLLPLLILSRHPESSHGSLNSTNTQAPTDSPPNCG